MEWLKNKWVIGLLIGGGLLLLILLSDDASAMSGKGSKGEGTGGSAFPLREGDRGQAVLDLQGAMNDELSMQMMMGQAPSLAFPIAEDGIFGPETANLATQIGLYDDGQVTREEYEGLSG